MAKPATHCAIENLSVVAFIPVLDAFKSRQTAIDIEDSNGQNLLHHAVKLVNVNLVRHLLHSQIEPGALDKQSKTALHVLVIRHVSNRDSDSRTVIQMTDLLLSAGTDILARNASGRTALDVAVPNENRPLIKHLVGGCQQ